MRNEFDDELEAALADDSSNKLDEVKPEQVKPKLFNKISIATVVGASIVTMFIGTAIGSALTAHRFESEQPAEILSVKSKSSSFDQLQDMREDVISSLTKQLAAKNNTPNNGDVQAATYNQTETTETATKVITALVQSGIKLDDVETSKSSSNNLPKETQDAIKTMLTMIRQFGTIIRLVYQVLPSLAQIQQLTLRTPSQSYHNHSIHYCMQELLSPRAIPHVYIL